MSVRATCGRWPCGARTRLVCRGGLVYGVLIGVGVVVLPMSAARAELTVCNTTASRIGLALGYKSARGWTTEGWWNIAAQTCESLLKGPLTKRYFYVYAVDYERGGGWSGAHVMCINSKSFTIDEVKDCEERGYRKAEFYEVDVGDAKTWTVRLSDSEKTKRKPK